MKNNLQLNNNLQWTYWQKVAFRFFFIFLTLQVFTESFLGNLFGRTLFIWQLGEKIFVQPCLWLNNHIFHFRYNSQGWTTFSEALHTIRDTVYLLLACFVCIVWTIFDKRRHHYNRQLYWFSQFLVIVLSCLVFFYGIIKLFPVQMQAPSFIDLRTPVGDLEPFDLLWTTFGFGQAYQVFAGFFEVSGAILILFNRTRVTGLLIITSAMVNVVMVNYTYRVGVLILSFYILLVTLFLLAPYARQLCRFFLTEQPAILPRKSYSPGKNFKTIFLKIIGILFLGTSFILSFHSAYSLYAQRKSVNNSRQYSLVKNYIVDSDTIKLIENDTLRWLIWSERVAEGKRFVTIAAVKPGISKTYIIDRDILNRRVSLHPFKQNDTTTLNFNYADLNKNNWRLYGVINQKYVQVELQKINPDTTVKLLKTKRPIIVFDDE